MICWRSGSAPFYFFFSLSLLPPHLLLCRPAQEGKKKTWRVEIIDHCCLEVGMGNLLGRGARHQCRMRRTAGTLRTIGRTLRSPHHRSCPACGNPFGPQVAVASTETFARKWNCVYLCISCSQVCVLMCVRVHTPEHVCL